MSVYDLLFKKDLGKWSQEFNKYKKAIKDISKRIDECEKKYGSYYPEKENLFKAFELTPLEKVKVVIVGQDPYPSLLANGKCRAQGLSFSVSKEDSIPGSLKNIYKEIKNDFPMFQEPKHGDISYLAKREGVFLFNQSLSYCPTNPKCYLNLWNRFTNIVINILNENIDNCIYILWGKKAENLAESIKSREIITGVHPSPISANRGFFNKKYFLKINITLKNQNKKQINFNEDEKILPTYLENLKN